MKDKIRVDAGGYLHVQSDHIKCACFLISSATVHFTRNPSVVLDTQWLHTATSTRHILWCQTHSGYTQPHRHATFCGVRHTVATHSHLYTPHSVVSDTQWLHRATSTRHCLWCQTHSGYIQPHLQATFCSVRHWLHTATSTRHVLWCQTHSGYTQPHRHATFHRTVYKSVGSEPQKILNFVAPDLLRKVTKPPFCPSVRLSARNSRTVKENFIKYEFFKT